VSETGTQPVAALQMYDRAELRTETDRLWAAVRDTLRAAGVVAPDALSRPADHHTPWTDPGLVLSQTCGLPFATWLAGKAAYVTTPAFALPGCAPGMYRSALVVAAGSHADTVADLAGARPAINANDSQSGYGALMHALAAVPGGLALGPAVLTGSHGASMAAVADGRADLAAIDAVTWALAERYDALTQGLKVIGWTEPTPGLPLITRPGANAALIADCVEAAIADLDAATREALLLTGTARLGAAAYAPLATRLAEAEAQAISGAG